MEQRALVFEFISVDPGAPDYGVEHLVIFPGSDLYGPGLFPVLDFIDDNLEWLVAAGATHTLLLPRGLLELAVGWIAFLTMIALDKSHCSPLCIPNLCSSSCHAQATPRRLL
ncbi:hypothetical protein ACFL3K_02205 [Pseudomonadota bacterium]